MSRLLKSRLVLRTPRSITKAKPDLHIRLLTTTPTPTPTPTASSSTITEETDLLIIGSGAGALTANLTAKKHGLRSIIIEKEPTIGGVSAISGGGLWIPCNPLAAAHGIRDSREEALKYFEGAVGDVGRASSREKREAFLDNAPRVIEFLQKNGFEFRLVSGYPDYYPDMQGAMGEGGGRSVESKAFDVRRLGEWERKLPPGISPLPMGTADASVLTQMMSSPKRFAQAMGIVLPLVAKGLLGQKLAGLGRALVAQLLYLNIKNNALDIRLQTKLSRLIQSSTGEVLGAEVKSTSESTTTSIHATHGVLLAAGGFAHNFDMRERFLPKPASTKWTSSAKGDTGDAIQEGIRIGAATALMDDAWWGPTIVDPVSFKNHFTLMERCLPHSFIVDSSGNRFMNEAQSYTDAGHDQYERHKHASAIPAWLIMDSNYRNRYMLGRLPPRQKPSKEAISSGTIFKAGNIKDLARKIGVDQSGLSETTTRYNEMCKTGVDTDFGKGSNVYNRYFGDPAYRPNPNMGPLVKPPYYAIAVWPGDLGTKGGLLTDEFQRVLDQGERPIPGLFAIGNTAASIMGRTYLGAGSTLGPAMTHGFIVANYLARQ